MTVVLIEDKAETLAPPQPPAVYRQRHEDTSIFDWCT